MSHANLTSDLGPLHFLTWSALPLKAPMHCGSAMDWDVLRAAYVCHCGATA